MANGRWQIGDGKCLNVFHLPCRMRMVRPKSRTGQMPAWPKAQSPKPTAQSLLVPERGGGIDPHHAQRGDDAGEQRHGEDEYRRSPRRSPDPGRRRSAALSAAASLRTRRRSPPARPVATSCSACRTTSRISPAGSEPSASRTANSRMRARSRCRRSRRAARSRPATSVSAANRPTSQR